MACGGWRGWYERRNSIHHEHWRGGLVMSTQITHVDPEETIRKLKARVARLEKAQLAPVQPVAWLEILRNNKTATDEVIGAFLRGHAEHLTGETFVLTTPPAAQPAVPDAIHHTDLSESLEYIQGWNDCRAEMLKGMKS
jgi:hypothetical protein